MNRKFALTLLTTVALASVLLPRAVCAQTISIWQVDVCDKVFADSAPPGAACEVVSLRAASNEYESAQIGVRSDQSLSGLTARISELRAADGSTLAADSFRVRVVGTIPIEHNTPLAETVITRKAPCDMPDVLYDSATFDLVESESKSLWITARIPKGTAPGLYSGALLISNEIFSQEVAISLEVFPFELSDERSLYMTNWWSPGNIADRHKVGLWDDDYWPVLDKYLANMGEHRQNILYIPWRPYSSGIVRATLRKDGTWSFDFSIVEKLLDLAEKNGVADRIELSHIGGINRADHVVNYLTAEIYDEAKGEWRGSGIDEWLAPCLKALCDYLRSRGLFERTMIHVADEPYIPDIDSWREASERIHKIEPELKRIDAIETVNFTDRLEVWVPKLSHFDRWRKAFDARRDQGEFWYYICCHPYGSTYPNRFMDLPGVRVRVLHWVNYSEDLVGYLHWGYNYWHGDPFGPPTKSYGPGDTHCVYPGENGPLDSIRWELQRESVEDYEYLKLLEKSVADLKSTLDPEKAWFIDPKARALELARRVVPDLKHTTLDANLLNQARADLANEIVAATGPVKLVVQTYPEDGSTAVQGPVLHELYGYASPGAETTINGDAVAVSADGFFKKQLDLKSGRNELEIVATLDGQSVKTTRVFFVE